MSVQKQKSKTGITMLVIGLIAVGAGIGIFLVVNNAILSTTPVTITGNVSEVHKSPLENDRFQWSFKMLDEASGNTYTVILNTNSSVTISLGMRLTVTGTPVNAAAQPYSIEASSFKVL